MLASLADQVLNTTNRYRAQHEAPPVTWNSTLADYAEHYAQRCVWKHSGGPYGENLAANFERTTLAIDAWGMEESKYNYGKADFDEVHGHFTQLVWQNTTQVGCGVADCHNHAEHGVTGAYLVCEYAPRGNVPGEFQDNVVKPGMGEDGKLGIGGGSGFSDGLRTYTVTLLVIYVVFALCFLC